MVATHDADTKEAYFERIFTEKLGEWNMPAIKRKSGLTSTLNLAGVKLNRSRSEPLWKGPEVDGITQSMLSRWLCCRERFRLLVVEGLRPVERFNSRLEFGNMWHVSEEALHSKNNWEDALKTYCVFLAKRYRSDQEQIDKWYNAVLVQFPIYLDFWKKHPDTTKGVSLLQEYAFKVPYVLPSGRIVLLRGKWDTVDLLHDKQIKGIYVQDHKTKGDINQEQLCRQLGFDLQTMIYLVAAHEHILQNGPLSKDSDGVPLRGIRYNVIRRPLSGGRGSIKQLEASKNRKAETKDEYFKRLQKYFIEDPEYWFMRWKVEVSHREVEQFKRQFLNPCLEQLCNWWDWVSYCKAEGFDPFDNSGLVNNDVWPHSALHFRLPFGIYNPIAEGGSTDLDEYLATGSEVGLERATKLFTELG